jgi:putative ABC transport system permease protein
MIALARTRELALLRLIGATRRQVRSMARWDAGLAIAFGVGLGTVIAYGSLMLFAHAIGADAPYVPIRQLALILGGSVALGFVGSQIPTRIALRARPVDAIGLRD